MGIVSYAILPILSEVILEDDFDFLILMCIGYDII